VKDGGGSGGPSRRYEPTLPDELAWTSRRGCAAAHRGNTVRPEARRGHLQGESVAGPAEGRALAPGVRPLARAAGLGRPNVGGGVGRPVGPFCDRARRAGRTMWRYGHRERRPPTGRSGRGTLCGRVSAEAVRTKQDRRSPAPICAFLGVISGTRLHFAPRRAPIRDEKTAAHPESWHFSSNRPPGPSKANAMWHVQH
jgi:hypothetical protein